MWGVVLVWWFVECIVEVEGGMVLVGVFDVMMYCDDLCY